MIRTLLAGLLCALVSTAVAWFLVPASTYVEDALGILMLVFAVTGIAGMVAYRRMRLRKG
jgi:hypothetical protein